MNFGYDIGVVKIRRYVKFYSSCIKYIGPICLAAMYELGGRAEITTVGWGRRYSEFPENIGASDRNPTESSCTTNEIGPLQHRFKLCDMKAIKDNGWKCNGVESLMKNAFPKGYNSEACAKHWHSAERAVVAASEQLNDDQKKAMLDRYERVNRIDIEMATGDSRTCYKMSQFLDGGWCKVSGATSDEEWGFCSKSCDPSLLRVYINVFR